MSRSDIPPASEIIDAVMAAPEFVDRLRHLRSYRERYDAALVDGFRRRAEAARRRDPREAGRFAQLGLVVAEAIGDRRSRLACLMESVKAAVMRNDTTQALDSIEDASRLAREICDERALGDLDMIRVQVLIALERHADARTCAESALILFERRADRRGRIQAHMALADLAFRLDRPRESLSHYRVVGKLLAPDTPASIRGTLAMNLANALVACNRFRAASRHFERARSLFRAEGWDHSVAQADYNSAYGELLRGDYLAALRQLDVCEKVFQREGDVRHLAHIDLDRAEIHLHLERPEEASAFATSAEVRFLTLGLMKERAQAVYLYARASEIRGDVHTATTWFERAERLFRELGLAERVVACVVSRGEVLERAGATVAARRLALDARRTLRDDMNPLSAARVALLMARLDLASGAVSAAVAAVESVLESCRLIRAPWLRIEAWTLLARALAQPRTTDALRDDATGHEEGESAQQAKSRSLADLVAGRRPASAPPLDGALAAEARARRRLERLDLVSRRRKESKGPASARTDLGPATGRDARDTDGSTEMGEVDGCLGIP